MPDEQLQEIRERAEQATPGPWRYQSWEWRIYSPPGTQLSLDWLASVEGSAIPDADGDFIAHAREDIPVLLAEVERLRKLLDSSPNRH